MNGLRFDGVGRDMFVWLARRLWRHICTGPVAASILAGRRAGVQPGGKRMVFDSRSYKEQACWRSSPGQQDAALYVRQDEGVMLRREARISAAPMSSNRARTGN